MGKIVKTEKSADNKFEFTLFDNGTPDEPRFIIEIRKFWVVMKGKIRSLNFNRFDRMTFTPSEFEKFKTWINHFERKDTK